MVRFIVSSIFLALRLCLPIAYAESAPQTKVPDPLTAAFGKVPETWGARLSPDGSKISFLHMVEADVPIAYVLAADGEPDILIASKPGEFDVYRCEWANNDRLLCGFYGIARVRGRLVPTTRLVAANADGTENLVLMQNKLRNEFAQFQDDIVDWLPDDPEHILVELPSENGSGVSRVNIYTGKITTEERVRTGVREWISDGRGTVRLRQYMSTSDSKWYFRLAGAKKWQLLHESKMTDIDDDYYPLGFGADRNALLVYKPHQGRLALWSEDLEKTREDILVYGHPDVDVHGTLILGKFRRLVAVRYSTDKPHFQYFDEEVRHITQLVQKTQPGKNVSVVDESWDKKFYLVHIGSDQDPGRYYRLDIENGQLQALYAGRPELEGYALAEMAPIRYPTRDGAEIPGYLTLPPGKTRSKLPAVVLPHGGPESRDDWDFDWLVQYMAARGYAVLQSNFRGSGGFGAAWAGEGGFRAWRRTMNDINDGAHWLIDEEIADPDRICVVGWSYGGYAALMSAIEEPALYKCIVSIAGVTDPGTLISDYRYFLSRRSVREFVGTDAEVIKHGSPVKRADEIESPVLMFHGDRDLNVNIKHSKKMHKALKKAKKATELIIYDDIAHSIWRNGYRVDMLGKIGNFLDANIGEQPVTNAPY